MRVMLVVPNFPDRFDAVGGVFFRDYAELLAAAGHEVAVVVADSTKRWVRRLRYRGAVSSPLRALRLPRLVLASAPWLVRPLIGLRWSPDVIHAHVGIRTAEVAARLAVTYDRPWVLTEHSTWIGRGLLSPELVEHQRRVLGHAARVTAVSGFLRSEMMNAYAGAEWAARIAVAPNGVHPAFFDVRPAPGNGPLAFVAVGYLKPVKGFDLMLRALAQVRATHDVRLTVIGDGPERARLERLVQELGISAAVRLAGAMDREALAAEFARSDVLVSASSYETFGLSIAEGLATGLRAVVVDAGGPRDFADLVDGALVPPGDVAALAAAMASVTRQGRLAAAEREARRLRVAGRFGFAAVAAQLGAVYAGAGVELRTSR